MKSTGAKYQVVRDALSQAIRDGEFHAGERLPSERQLAAQFGVSHMTARHAVTDLVESELLERRPGSGIYVRPQTREKLSTITLNLICAAQSSSITQAFLHFGSQGATRRGWRIRVTRLHHGHERPVVRAIREGEPALVFLDAPNLWSSLSVAMQHADGRAVLIGNRMDDKGVPSVMADDALAFDLAVKHLKAAGHRRVALISNNVEHVVGRVQIATWKAAFGEEAAASLQEKRLIIVNVEDFHSRAQSAYAAVQNYLASGGADTTALISTDDEMALGALAACHDAGYPVPQRMSLINSGDSTLLELARPVGITVMDVRMRQHIEAALEMVEAALAGTLSPRDRLRLVGPRLIKRGSVCPPHCSGEKKSELF